MAGDILGRECFCDVNAYALKGMCECDEDCSCEGEGCECEETIDMWSADLPSVCSCGGNCRCGQSSDEAE